VSVLSVNADEQADAETKTRRSGSDEEARRTAILLDI
jgi:hypothetical protein